MQRGLAHAEAQRDDAGVTRRRVIGALVTVTVCVSACGGGHRSSAGHAPAAQPRAGLFGAHPCRDQPDFKCSILRVPLDHAAQAGETLALTVGVSTVRSAPRGVLLFLTGGPGQPGVPFLTRVQARLRAALVGYRLVMFDERGTGAGALVCPSLQAAAGASDLTIAPQTAVSACARSIGAARRFYSTPETVADIEQLRVALGAKRLTLDGVSYGTYVAERYALAHPTHVARLVLDSVVPHAGVDPLYRAALASTGRVLRSVCAEQRCPWDPAADVAAVIGRLHDGPDLLNALVAESVAAPDYPHVLEDLHAARLGRPQALERFTADARRDDAAPAAFLSQGLHESTLCLDLASPWNPNEPSARRAATLAALAAAAPRSDFYPFDRATATGNGLARGCVDWPPTRPPAVPDGSPTARLPAVPVLLFVGEHDLSAPLPWARAEAATAPRGHLLEVPGAGHSVQLRARDPNVRHALARFLRTG